MSRLFWSWKRIVPPLAEGSAATSRAKPGHDSPHRTADVVRRGSRLASAEFRVEAIMISAPAVCRDRCGSADVVRASARGGVFPAKDLNALIALLRRIVDEGAPSTQQRAVLAGWSQRFGTGAGADYLRTILAFVDPSGKLPAPSSMLCDKVAR